MARSNIVIALPVRNEQDHIVPCLKALATGQTRKPDRIVLLLNNCTDDTAARVGALRPNLPVPCDTIDVSLHGAESCAGFARSLAFRQAGAGLRDNDLLFTTDADGRAAPDWIERSLAAFARGADAVCGRAVLSPADARTIPAHLHADDARETALGRLNDEVACLLDPDPQDPWPRHTEHSGASIAVRAGAWRAVGGIPPLACGEDRAFINALRRHDAHIRHDPSVIVTVSARIVGRAVGGMADTIRRRIQKQDELTDDAIEPAADRFRRVVCRARARAIWSGETDGASALANSLAVSIDHVWRAMALPFFGQAWDMLEQVSSVLTPRRVRFTDLPAEISAATALRDAAAFLAKNQPALVAERVREDAMAAA